MMYRVPTRVWRAAVLATPRYFVNNMVGNSAMAILNDPAAFRHYVEAIKVVKGHKHAEKLLKENPGHSVRWMNEIFGSIYGHGFVEDVPEWAVKGDGKLSTVAKLANKEKAWYRKVNEVTEERYRVQSVLKRVRFDPEITAMRKQGLSEYEAVMAKHRADPQWSQRISDEVDDMFGQYRYLNKLERGVRDLGVPFYSWSRAITRSTATTFKDRPGRFYMMYLVGEHGIQETQEKLGELPRFLQGAIPLPGGSEGRKNILTTSGFNPWATPVELGTGAVTLAGGPGRTSETLGAQLGPLGSTAVEALTGERLITGQPHNRGLGGLLAENFGIDPSRPGLPPLKLGAAFLRGDEPGNYVTPTGRKGERLYDPDKWNELLAVLGFPKKSLSPRTAQKRARQEDAY
jgi:hypothetical protein